MRALAWCAGACLLTSHIFGCGASQSGPSAPAETETDPVDAPSPAEAPEGAEAELAEALAGACEAVTEGAGDWSGAVLHRVDQVFEQLGATSPRWPEVQRFARDLRRAAGEAGSDDIVAVTAEQHGVDGFECEVWGLVAAASQPGRQGEPLPGGDRGPLPPPTSISSAQSPAISPPVTSTSTRS